MDNHAEAEKFVYDNHSFFSSLADRWQDEQEYEDWQEYVNAAKKKIEASQLIFVKLKKHPLSCVFRPDKSRNVEYHLVVTKNKVRLDICEIVNN